VSVNYFELLDIPQSFDLDKAEVKQRVLRLQRLFHPDRYVMHTEAERRVAAQKSAEINQAAEILLDDTRRAEYLLQCQGVDVESVQPDSAMLMRQMMLREELEEAETPEAQHAILQDLTTQYQQLYQRFNTTWHTDSEKAVQTMLEMKFIDKLQQYN
jgi:molecular chaperone HscB